MTEDKILPNKYIIKTEKLCFHCKTIKPASEYHKGDPKKGGLGVYCKICTKIRKQLPENKIKRALYMSQDRCKRNYAHKGIQSFLTIKDIELLWHRDNAQSMRKPSLDRIDNDGHYILDNCRFVELSENTAKDKRKVVMQYTLEGDLIAEYPSTPDAAKAIGCSKSTIIACCMGTQIIGKGFIWRYKP